MEMLTTNKKAVEEIIAIARKNSIKPISWFDFNSMVSEIWFAGKLTWEQKEQISSWSWEIENVEGSEYIFGAVVNAYNQNAIVW